MSMMKQDPPTPSRSNSHPYAIVTTSTALLTRSNTTSGPDYRHSYSPTPPPKSPSHPSQSRRDFRNTHRHSRSLVTFPLPPPLPSPPKSHDAQVALSDDDAIKDEISDDPRFWSSARLSNDLIAAGAHELAQLVNQHHVSARTFLRLSPSTDLPEWASLLSEELVESLYDHARRLRLISLKARIWDLQVPGSGDEALHSPTTSASPTKSGRVKHLVRALEDRAFQHGLRSRTRSVPTIPDDCLQVTSFSRTSSSDYEDGFASGSDNGSDSGGSIFGQAIRTPSEELPPNIAVATSPVYDEPSVEHLLSSSPTLDAVSWGAKAWEDDVLVATARRIPFTPAKAPESGTDVTATTLTGLFHPDFPMSLPSHEIDSKIEPELEEAEDNVRTPVEVLSDNDDTESSPPQSLLSARDEESMAQLQAKVAQLESRIKELESQAVPVAEETKAPHHDSELTDDGVDSLDLPQYLLMAGVGICAIVGQAVLRKIAGSRF